LNDHAVLNFVLPWVNLTSLTLYRVYPHECAPVLRQTTNLVHCELELYFHRNLHNERVDVTLPCLETLALKRPSASDYYIFMNHLQMFTTPALRGLEIPEGFLEYTPINSLASFISKSGCTLHIVRITGERLVPEDSYRSAFPLIGRFFFGDDVDAE